LNDPERNRPLLIVLAGRTALPVLGKTIELQCAARAQAECVVGGLIVNKRLPDGLGDFLKQNAEQEEAAFGHIEKRALPHHLDRI